MAADWRGWRLIVVGGERFRWQCLLGCPCGCCANAWSRVLVRAEAAPSRLLTVSGGREHFLVTLPGTVAEWIAHAQAHGWPTEQRAMELRLTNQPGVPELAVVD